MKIKLVLALMLSCAISAMAQGYQDGIDYFNAYRLDDAKELLNKNLNNDDTDKALSYYYLGLIELEQENPNLTYAEQMFQNGISADDKNPYCYIGMGQLTLASDKKAAEKYFKQAEKLAKKDPAVLAAIGRAYFNVDPKVYNKEVSKYIQQGHKVSKNNSPAVYMLQGDTAAYFHNSGAAAGFYETAIRMAKENNERINPEAYVKNANLHLKINAPYAIQMLKQLNDDEPYSALAQRELAEKYYDLDRLEDAVKQYAYYIKNPNHFQRDEQRLAALYFYAGAYSQALQWADKILAEDPNNFPMNRLKMYCLSDLRRDDEGIVAAEKFHSLDLSKWNAKDYEYYGEILSANDRDDEALEMFAKSVQLKPNNPDIYKKIATANYAVDQNAQAVENQKKYLQMSGNDQWYPKYRLGSYMKSAADDLSKAGDTDGANAMYDEAIAVYDTALDALINGANSNGDDALGAGADMVAIESNEKVSTAGDEGNIYRMKALTLYSKNGGACLPMIENFNIMIEKYKEAAPDEYLTKYKSQISTAHKLAGIYYLDQKDYVAAEKAFRDYLSMVPDDAQIVDIVGQLSKVNKSKK